MEHAQRKYLIFLLVGLLLVFGCGVKYAAVIGVSQPLNTAQPANAVGDPVQYQIKVFGEVQYPGNQYFAAGTTIEEALQAFGLKPTADTSRFRLDDPIQDKETYYLPPKEG